ncbi:MAG: response regulator [Planctomycetales bacterium]|nr:response regulator [Planctomycetales bacterium]
METVRFSESDLALTSATLVGEEPACPTPKPAASTRPRTGAEKPGDFQDSKILIVDDEPINIKAVRRHLMGSGYRNFVTCSDAPAAMDLIRREKPDLVLLDIMMPEVSGLEILEQVQQDESLRAIPILVLTASSHRTTKLQALELGANDFLAKPVDPNELVTRVRNALIIKAHHDHLSNYSERLEREVEARTAELASSQLQLIHYLARAAEFRDSDTGMHVVRVGRYAGLIARELELKPKFCELIEQAALLHDVGKIAIPDAILHKPGRLTPEEFNLMKRHCIFGAKIVQPLPSTQLGTPASRRFCESPLITMAAKIALTHHEKWDGSGYPRGLKGQEIPIEGRITAVADVFDALSSSRSYKAAYSLERCLEIMIEDRGSHFDPRVLDAFLSRIDEIRTIQSECTD